MKPEDANFEIEPIIDKLTYDKLQDTEKKLYREKDGNYEIRLKGGFEDINRQKSKTQAANEHLKNTQKKIADLERELAEQKKKIEDGDMTKAELDTSKQNETALTLRIKKIEEDSAAEKQASLKRAQILQDKALKAEKDNIVNALQDLIMDDERHFTRDYFDRRTIVVADGESTKVVFLDDNYKELVDTDLEGYKKNILANKKLQAKIKTVQASGGGASPSFLQGGANPTKWKDLTTPQKAELYAKDPETAKKLQEESKPSKFRS